MSNNVNWSSFWTAIGVNNTARQTELLRRGLVQSISDRTVAISGQTAVLSDINKTLKSLVDKKSVLERLVIEAIQDPDNVKLIREGLTKESAAQFDQLYSQYSVMVKLEIKNQLQLEAQIKQKNMEEYVSAVDRVKKTNVTLQANIETLLHDYEKIPKLKINKNTLSEIKLAVDSAQSDLRSNSVSHDHIDKLAAAYCSLDKDTQNSYKDEFDQLNAEWQSLKTVYDTVVEDIHAIAGKVDISEQYHFISYWLGSIASIFVIVGIITGFCSSPSWLLGAAFLILGLILWIAVFMLVIVLKIDDKTNNYDFNAHIYEEIAIDLIGPETNYPNQEAYYDLQSEVMSVVEDYYMNSDDKDISNILDVLKSNDISRSEDSIRTILDCYKPVI